MSPSRRAVAALAAVLCCAAVTAASAAAVDAALGARGAAQASGAPATLSAPASPAVPPNPTPKAERLAQMYAENEWKNSLVMWVLPEPWRAAMPHWVQSWFRCWLMASLIYFGLGSLWSYYVYFCYGDRLYKPGEIPTVRACMEQMWVAFWAMPLYALLPAATEAMCERGWTLAYARFSDVGLARYLLYFALYMTSVEFFVYWQHRLLHDIKPGYRLLHYIHHKYNKEHTLSPFAGLAFHPLDGILQALPYTWTLFYVPM